MANAKVSQETRDAAKRDLLEVLNDGDTVYTVLRSVSRSGMSRRIDIYKLEPHDGPDRQVVIPFMLTRNVSDLLELPHDLKHQGLRIDGCGMDMGYHLVDNLSRALGIELKQRWL